MPKSIELTVELDIQRVSCPGVWLCQDGRVSLTVFALGTSYQTCLLPPVFPLAFKDVFYFKKRFPETCALNNICCLLKDETIYCELVQWCVDCKSDECVILAQYLGSLNDVLFPPNMCSTEGVDLLMRRSKDFPGILSPKIEIATKVRIDEVWNQIAPQDSTLKVNPLSVMPTQEESRRQKQVCHTAKYHRNMCPKHGSPDSRSRSGSRAGSRDSRSCSSASRKGPVGDDCYCPNLATKAYLPCSRPKKRKPKAIRDFCVYNVQTHLTDPETCVSAWRNGKYIGHAHDTTRKNTNMPRTCQGTTRICKDTTRMCKDTVPMCKDTPRTCKGTTRICQDTTAICQETIPICRGTTRICQNTCQDTLLMCEDNIPMYQDNMPMYEDTIPMYQDTSRIYQDMTRMCQDSTRICQDSKRMCQDSTRKCQDSTRICQDSEYEEDTKRSISSSLEQGCHCFDDEDRQERHCKTTLESHFIGRNRSASRAKKTHEKKKSKNCAKTKIAPCICEICKRYHELFHLKNKAI